jgi:hypothetical protein
MRLRDVAILISIILVPPLPWYILVVGVFYYLFWRYLKYLDAKDTVNREREQTQNETLPHGYDNTA